MRYKDNLLEMAMLYLNRQSGRGNDIQLLLSNNPKYKDSRAELLQSVVDELKTFIQEN